MGVNGTKTNHSVKRNYDEDENEDDEEGEGESGGDEDGEDEDEDDDDEDEEEETGRCSQKHMNRLDIFRRSKNEGQLAIAASRYTADLT